MKKLLTLLLCLATVGAWAQVALTTPGTPVTIDFTGFTGVGFSPTPAAGELDSDDWAIFGMSDGALNFGDTRNVANTDFTRGVTPAGTQTSGGVYALDNNGNTGLWLQPTSNDFTPGDIKLRIVNNSGAPMSALELSYKILAYNDQTRSTSMNLSWSTDDVNYNVVPSMDYATVAAPDALPAVTSTFKSVVITGFNVPNGGFVYVKWRSDDAPNGTGSRDELGLDDVTVNIPTNLVPSINFAVTTQSAQENSGTISVTVSVTPSANCSVQAVISGAGTATNGTDYTFTTPTTLNFTVATPTVTLNIPIINDATPESAETVIVELQNANGGGAVVGATSQYTLTILDDDFAPVSGLVLTEIMYNPPEAGTDSLEYVEIYNNSGAPVNLQGCTFSSAFVYTFPAYTLNAGEYLAVAKSASAMQNVFGVTALQWASGTLNNAGQDTIRLFDALGTLLDEVLYDDVAPWPTAANGQGNSLVLCSPGADNSQPYNWFAATTPTGQIINNIPVLANPGAPDGVPCASDPTLTIAAAAYNVIENAGSVTVTVNIVNPNANPTSVNLTLGNGTATQGADYTYATTTLTFPANANTPQTVVIPILDDVLLEGPESFDLYLSNPTNNATFGTDSTTVTIADNDLANVTGLVISEINYNDPSAADSLEFIEILNVSAGTIGLQGVSITQGVNYVFQGAAAIAPGQRIVVARYPNVLFAQTGFSTPYQWNAGALNNTGEALVLLDGNGNVIDSVFFGDNTDPEWPASPDGTGPSLVLCDPNSDNNVGTNWLASTQAAGNYNAAPVFMSPGSVDPACPNGIEEVANPTFMLYPNPTQSDVTVQFALAADRQISVVGLDGKVALSMFATGNSAQVRTAGLPAGMYFVRVLEANSNQVSVAKLVIE